MSLPILPLLQGIACLAIILWGMNQASRLIVLALLGALVACSALPLPEWLMRRFKLGKDAAIGLGIALVGTVSLVTVFALYERIPRFQAALPEYQQRFMILYGKVVGFLNGQGLHLADASSLQMPSSEKMMELGRVVIPEAAGFLGDGLLVTMLSLIFLSAMVEQHGAKRSAFGETLRHYGRDVQRYIGVSAKTNGIAALANLVLFLALDVEFAALWSVLSFFLRFIPSIGFILSLVLPSFVALLALGWKRALLVVAGGVAISMVTDYVISPIFMRKSVNVSFAEMMLSVVFWSAVLGPVAGILAIPLTMVLRKFIREQFHEEELSKVTSG
jgi:predicted PurR-regulated permease PerM